jgi:hypothetical protein
LFYVNENRTVDKILKLPVPRNTSVNLVSSRDEQQLVEFADELTASSLCHRNILGAAHGRVKVGHRLAQLVINVERTRRSRPVPVNLAREPSWLACD